MNLLTNVFYLISTALLIPVMLVLLVSLVQVISMLGQLLREYLLRNRHAASLDSYCQALMHNTRPLPSPQPEADQGSAGKSIPPTTSLALLPNTLAQLARAESDSVLAEKLAADAQIAWRDEVERITGLARRGPALGLMGTLIPLGPALVGLAAGNLQMMSENLVIAFATTVVGLLIGTMAGAIVGVKKRWYRTDAALVEFALARVLEQIHSHQHDTNHEARQLPHGRVNRHVVASNGGNHHAKTVESHPEAQTAEAH